MTISVHLISTYSGSSEEDFIDKETYGTGDVYDVIDSPTAVCISINTAIAIGAFALEREVTSRGRIHRQRNLRLLGSMAA